MHSLRRKFPNYPVALAFTILCCASSARAQLYLSSEERAYVQVSELRKALCAFSADANSPSLPDVSHAITDRNMPVSTEWLHFTDDQSQYSAYDFPLHSTERPRDLTPKASAIPTQAALKPGSAN